MKYYLTEAPPSMEHSAENPENHFGEIHDFYGTSLSEIEILGTALIKCYCGPIYRGYEKLFNEKTWLECVPKDILSMYPKCIPTVLKYEKVGEKASLHLSLFSRTALTKEILKGEITARDTRNNLAAALDLLSSVIYPCEKGIRSSGKSLFHEYHMNRIEYAGHYLMKIEGLRHIFQSKKMIVNGIACPSISAILQRIATNSNIFFTQSNLVRFHGNFHLDNILIQDKSNPTLQNITLIDPRGELTGPPHYDFSKLLLTLQSYYDEINYNGFSIECKTIDSVVQMKLDINTSRNEIYSLSLQLLMSQIGVFAKKEGVSETQFYLSVLACNCIHVFSFLFYHSRKEPHNEKKLLAFIAILGLLGKDLEEFVNSGHANSSEDRLLYR